MAESDKAAADTPVAAVPPVEGAPIVPPKRSPGHRGADVKDTVAEMAAKAHEISLEAGSKMAAAMKDVVNAAAGLHGFVIESARDLVQYMVRRGQMTQEEADKLIRAAEEFQPKRKGALPVPPRTLPPSINKAKPPVAFRPEAPIAKPAAPIAAAPKAPAPRTPSKPAKPAPKVHAKPAAKSKPAAKKAAKPAKPAARKPAKAVKKPAKPSKPVKKAAGKSSAKSARRR